VQCDICGQEVDNSEALAKHKEEMHAKGEHEEPEREMENPVVPEPDEVPEPAPKDR
jgi:hypothetical protein